MDVPAPGDGQQQRKKAPPPREPMEGGSERPSLRDDAKGAAAAGWCDDCDCGGFPLLRLSLLLAISALVLPASASGPVLSSLRLYRRALTRFTPRCPSSPSCSAYALAAVERLGARRGLATAATRVRTCGGVRQASA